MHHAIQSTPEREVSDRSVQQKLDLFREDRDDT